ncbi:MAG: 2-phosphosulfolactate phosphatase [Candidatus Poribacteria bacterium]|nr:2-phosphosulfolactate phosphatase [Candidatus Poribacteria bacterium]
MRTLDVLLYLDATRVDLDADGAVAAIDILRATSTIAAALANGAEAVAPALSPEEAVEMRGDCGETLLGGERGNVKLDGFDLGNSPLEYTRAVVEGRTICFTTTNGTRLIRAAEGARRLFAGAFINISAVCRALEADCGNALLACAGTHGRLSLDDALFAGACVHRIKGAFDRLTDAARTAEALWLSRRGDLRAALREAEHAQTLLRFGYERDIDYAAQIDAAPVLPIYEAGRFRLRR